MHVHYSSAEYPQSNGSAESAVKVLKRLQQVCATESDLFRTVLYLQSTVKWSHTLSLAHVFLGSRLLAACCGREGKCRTSLIPR
jgi:hypothetical protein